MPVSIRKQLYLAAVPLSVVLILFVGSLAMRFFPLRDQVSDLRSDINEFSIAGELTSALNDYAVACAEALSNGKAMTDSGDRLQRALDAWTGEKRDQSSAMEAIEVEAVMAISRDVARLRRTSYLAIELKRAGRISEARALVAREVWPLIASVSRAVNDRATQEGMEIAQSLGMIRELTGSWYSPGSGRLHDEMQELMMEVAAQVEGSRLARALVLEQLAVRYAPFVGNESLDEALSSTRDSKQALASWGYILEQGRRTPESTVLFSAIQREYGLLVASRAAAQQQTRIPRSTSIENGPANSLLELVHQYLARSHQASEQSFRAVVAAATQALLLALLLGALIMLGGLSIPAALGRRTLRRISSLQESIRSLREGTLDVVAEVGAPDELGTLAASFNEMARELERTAAAREQSDERFRSVNRQRQLLLDSVGDGIVGIDPAGMITFVNHGGEDLLLTSVDRIQGKHVHDVFHGQDADHARQSCLIQGPVVSGTPYSAVDDHFLRGNGATFAADVISNPVLDEQAVIVGAVICFRDVTERRALERMKSEFVSTVSHELRTPLTSIRGALGLLATGLLTDVTEKGQRMLDIAVANTDRLVRLINDILDVEKLDAEAVMSQENVDAGELIRRSIETMKPMAEKVGVTLSCSPGTGTIRADPDRIIQTLTNLISNAIKFSGSGSQVMVRTKIELGFWQCEVRDEGRGIPADKLDLIFERFQQVDASDSRDKGGTGLGLSICRSIIQQHGGRIWVESKLNHGSTFFFTVPLAHEEIGHDQPAVTFWQRTSTPDRFDPTDSSPLVQKETVPAWCYSSGTS
jgi:PAS domain S-box-containing protein